MFFLHRLTEQFKGFNVFYYVTFRAVLAAITAFVISLLFGNFVIRKLISLKIGQPIRTASSALKPSCGGKQGTPTMAACSSSTRLRRVGGLGPAG
jgi:phospho-N-acetylmuramoyl-pentapeptide-transferase